MARNGAGTFSPTNGTHSGNTLWTQDRDAGDNILAARFDSFSADVATALTGSIAADGQTPVTANLPMAGFRHTNVGNAAARSSYAAAGQIQDGGLIWGGTTGGSATAFTISLTPALAAYALGGMFAFIPHATNTGSNPTLNVNGLGAYIMVGADGSTGLRKGGLVIGRVYLAFYDSASGGKIHVLNPSGGSTAGWTTWSPTVSKTGAGTYTVTGTPVYAYRLNWPKVEFKIDIHGTVAGAITAVSLTLPSGVTVPALNHYNSAILDFNSPATTMGKVLVNDSSITIQEYTGAAWPAGTCGLHTAIVSAELS